MHKRTKEASRFSLTRTPTFLSFTSPRLISPHLTFSTQLRLHVVLLPPFATYLD